METSELETRLQESLGTVLEYVEKAAGFAADQAPLLVQEIISWGIVYNIAIAIFAAIIATCSWYLVHRVTHACITTGNSYSSWSKYEAMAVSVIAGLFAFVPVSIVVIDHTMKAAKAIVAPRLYVLDILSGLVQ